MNTIPSTFSENIPSYTAVGCKERLACAGISAVILNKPGFINRSFLQEIERVGFDNIISVESASPHYDLEELTKRFPFVRFILPEKELNLGEQINLAALEIDSPLFFVLRNDMKIIAGGTARRMAERLCVSGRLCTVPVIINSNYESLPTIVFPVTRRKKVRTAFFEPNEEGGLSLYPFDGIGIYDRKRFIETGGFDSTIKKPYWQLLDFGFRSFLWGEEIALGNQLKLMLESDIPAEDYTAEISYTRFNFKNLAPVFKNYAHLPYFRFISFLGKTNEDFFNTYKEFREARKWVKKNKYRWKYSTNDVIKRWDK